MSSATIPSITVPKDLKYQSSYESEISYSSDKNFMVRLKCLLDIRMKEAGYNTRGKKFKALIDSIEKAEDYLFDHKTYLKW